MLADYYELNVDEIIIGYNKGFKKYGIKNTELKGKKKRKTNLIG